MRLFIAEKPELAKAIVTGLGGGFLSKDGYYQHPINQDTVTYCYGHMLALKDPEDIDEKYQDWRMDTLPIEPVLPAPRKVPKDKVKQVKIIKELVNKATTIINAGDPDDEGQLLIDELLRFFGNKKPVMRVLINDNTPAVVEKALQNLKPNRDFEHLGYKAESRMIADQLFGYNLTRAYSLQEQAKTGKHATLHLGRVQTPILGLVVRRDREYKSHQKAYYYVVAGEFEFNGIKFFAKYQPKDTDPIDDKGRLIDKNFASNLSQFLSNKNAKILLAHTQSKKQPAPLPYNLLTLQQDASRIFNLGSDETDKITQSLREKHHLITYNRSDCQYLSDEQFADVNHVLTAIRGTLPSSDGICERANPNQKGRAFNSSKVTAHHAIIPTQTVGKWSDLSEDEKNIYKIISRNYLAQFYPFFEYDETKITIDVIVDGQTYQFYATSRIETAIGWKFLYKHDPSNAELIVDEDTQTTDLRQLQSNMQGYSRLINSHEQETKPKPLYTEDTLLGDLTRVAKYVKDPKLAQLLKDKDKDKQGENGGIGTPATRSSMIKKLLERGYMVKKGKNIISTELGQALYDKLDDLIRYPDMSAVWYEQQQEIKSPTDVGNFVMGVLNDTVVPTLQKIKQTYTAPPPKQPKDLSNNPRCPRCNRPMVLRDGKFGEFWGCTGWSSKENPCNHSMNNDNGTPVEKPAKKPVETSNFDCKKCGKKLILRQGTNKTGKPYSFFGCSGFPKCKQKYDEVNGEPKYD